MLLLLADAESSCVRPDIFLLSGAVAGGEDESPTSGENDADAALLTPVGAVGGTLKRRPLDNPPPPPPPSRPSTTSLAAAVRRR